jgi:hypothetical protein
MVNQQLINYIKTEEAQVYTPQQLRNYLIQQGYNAQEVDEAISHANQRNIYPRTQNVPPTQTSQNTTPQERPTAITVLSILFFIFGAISLIQNLISIIQGAKSMDLLQMIPIIGPLLNNFIIIFTILGLIMGAVNVLIGWGLWTLQNWARVTALVLSIIGLVILILFALVTLITIIGPIILLIPIIIQIIIIHILRKDTVKKAFGV